MNLIKKIALVAMTVLMGTGVAVGVGNTLEIIAEPVYAAEKTSPDGKRAILVEGTWGSSSMKIHYWGGSSGSSWNSRPSMNDTGKKSMGGDKIFYFDIPYDTTHILFTNQWNDQTVDIQLSSTLNSNNHTCFYWNDGNGLRTVSSYLDAQTQSTITYDPNFSSANKTSSNFSWGSQIKVSSNSFSREGHKFLNWNTAKDGSGTSYNPNDTFYSSSANITLYAIWELETYNVKEYAIYDGSEPVLLKEGKRDITYSPLQADKTGYVSKGIYFDQSGTEPFDKIIKEASLYHIYETEKYEYIYFGDFDRNHWGANSQIYFYSWNSKTGTEFNGSYGTEIIAENYLARNVNFNNSGLYRYPILVNGKETPDKFIIRSNKNDSTQTEDLNITYGAYYSVNSLFLGAVTGFDGDKQIGDQAALIYKLNDLRLNSSDYTDQKGNTYSSSICSISLDDTKDILNGYNLLDDTTLFDSAKIETINMDNRPNNSGIVTELADYTGLEILTQLLKIHQLDFNGVQSSKLAFLYSSDNNSKLMLIVLIAVVATSLFATIAYKKISKKEK